MPDSLDDLAVKYGTDKGSTGHDYCPTYEHYLGHLAGERFTLLEVGVFVGASLRMWRDYFRDADIIGVDIDPTLMIHDEDRITTWLGDAADVGFWGGHPCSPLVIIDDGSHLPVDVTDTFACLWPRLRPGGWYFIEDLNSIGTNFWSSPWTLGTKWDVHGELAVIRKPLGD